MTSNDIAYTRDVELFQSTVQIMEERQHDQRKILRRKTCRYDEFLVPAKVPNYPDHLIVMVAYIIEILLLCDQAVVLCDIRGLLTQQW